jgi:hypothetical protein
VSSQLAELQGEEHAAALAGCFASALGCRAPVHAIETDIGAATLLVVRYHKQVAEQVKANLPGVVLD